MAETETVYLIVVEYYTDVRCKIDRFRFLAAELDGVDIDGCMDWMDKYRCRATLYTFQTTDVTPLINFGAVVSSATMNGDAQFITVPAKRYQHWKQQHAKTAAATNQQPNAN